MTDLRTLTSVGFTNVRRHGIRLTRIAKSLMLLVLVLSTAVVELSAISLGLSALAFVLAVLSALLALLFYMHAQRLFKVQPDDLLAYIDGEEVDGRGTVIFRNGNLMCWTTEKNVRQVAALPASAGEALSKIKGIPGGVTTREMSPEEAAEYVKAVPFMSEGVLFMLALALLGSFSLGYGAPLAFMSVIGAGVILHVLRTVAHRQFRRVSSPILTVRTDTEVGHRQVRWAEFVPDGRPWTIEGEPAMWRRP